MSNTNEASDKSPGSANPSTLSGPNIEYQTLNDHAGCPFEPFQQSPTTCHRPAWSVSLLDVQRRLPPRRTENYTTERPIELSTARRSSRWFGQDSMPKEFHRCLCSSRCSYFAGKPNLPSSLHPGPARGLFIPAHWSH